MPNLLNNNYSNLFHSMSLLSTQIAQMDEDDIIQITSAPITSVFCFTMSLTRKFGLIGTQSGFCIVDNIKKTFLRFEGGKNPFGKQPNTGVKLGAVLEQRTEVAVIPSKESKKFHKNTVYIYDFQLQTILYANDFFLPIRQIALTDDTIIVSNNKRIIVYNYSNDVQSKSQSYYLQMYASSTPNNNIHYFEMGCEEKLGNNAISQFDGESTLSNSRECLCGKFTISGVKPYKILFCKVYTLNGSKMIQLSIYDWGIDKDYPFQSFPYNQNFSFSISQDGNYVSYTQSQGRGVVIYKLDEKGVYCNLWISSSIKSYVSNGFFFYEDSLWFTAIRKSQNTYGSMHFFKIQKKKQEKQYIKSRYSRYFSLYEKTMVDYNISKRLIGPEFYVINGAVFSPSLCGAVLEIIDFKISGNHPKKNVDNFIKWREELQS